MQLVSWWWVGLCQWCRCFWVINTLKSNCQSCSSKKAQSTHWLTKADLSRIITLSSLPYLGCIYESLHLLRNSNIAGQFFKKSEILEWKMWSHWGYLSCRGGWERLWEHVQDRQTEAYRSLWRWEASLTRWDNSCHYPTVSCIPQGPWWVPTKLTTQKL